MDVAGQLEARIGRALGIIIMVSGGDEHRHGDLLQTEDQLLAGLIKGVVAVEQVAREEHKVDLFAHGERRDPPEQLALFAAADGRLARAEPLKGGVEMQVGRVQDP